MFIVQKYALIFNVIEYACNPLKKKEGQYPLSVAARQPEFDWTLERNLFGDNNMVQIIKALFDDDYKYLLSNILIKTK